MIRVLLFSEEAKLRPLLTSALQKDFEVKAEGDVQRLKEDVNSGAFDVLVFDLEADSRLEARIPILEELADSDVALVILTDDGARSTAIELVQQGAHSYCRKPPALRELKAAITRANEHIQTKRQLLQTAGGGELDGRKPDSTMCDGLIGSSEQMLHVYELVRRVANLNASVLITGESGTGKELVARAMHNLGNRAHSPFVAVSCGAIPETLIESELFGHEKGAFTGSTGTRIGFFEQAASGTLFLDEIGELSLQTQVKLLRVLQQREFSRLGSNRPLPLKARLIFATHRNLPQLVAEGKFRLDLFYRVNVVTIATPSLAERPEDIFVLAQHFLEQYAALYEKPISGLAPKALRLLEQYEWPGNVRELENAIQSAIIRSDSDIIEPEDLPETLQQELVRYSTRDSEPGDFEQLVRDYKVKLAMKAIQECNGNKSLAALSLNISRAYLHRLVRMADLEAIGVA